MPRVLAVCAVRQLRPDDGPVGVTAIDKAPVTGPVHVGLHGVRGDVRADLEHHSGLPQAVYAYAQEDADFWGAQLGRDLPAGFFGENLRTEGIDVNDARVGERWRIGSALEVEVTYPRRPCQTFARWVGGADEHGWVKRFAREQRLGPYLRVITPGRITAGDEITVLHRPDGPRVVDVERPALASTADPHPAA